MPSHVSLVYPNGRTAHAVLDEDVEPGQEFELHGRRWRVVGKGNGRSRYSADAARTVCRAISPKTS